MRPIEAFRHFEPEAFIRYTHGERESRVDVLVWEQEPHAMATFTIRKVNRALGFVCKLEIREDLRGRGLYRPLHQLKLEYARALGYPTLMATVRSDNERELLAARRVGWATYAQLPGADVPFIYMMLLSTSPHNTRTEDLG